MRDPERFDAWLHRLIVNAAIDETRRRRRRVIQVSVSPIEVPSTQDDIGRLVDRDELDRVLSTLRPEHRALVVLHYYLGMPLPEAAASLGIWARERTGPPTATGSSSWAGRPRATPARRSACIVYGRTAPILSS